MLLTKHEGVRFQNQTVYISGQAFVRCSFVACTLVLRETVYYMEGCTFERCNWHVDWVLMWGSPESLREIKVLVGLIEQAQQTQPATPGGSMPTGQNPAQQAAPQQPMVTLPASLLNPPQLSGGPSDMGGGSGSSNSGM